jgi:hypothetical protein
MSKTTTLTNRPVSPGKDPLVGRGFHTFDTSGKVLWQGEVIAALSGGRYLAQLFSWLHGGPTQQVVLDLANMAAAAAAGTMPISFYDTPEEMAEYWAGHLQHLPKNRGEAP